MLFRRAAAGFSLCLVLAGCTLIRPIERLDRLRGVSSLKLLDSKTVECVLADIHFNMEVRSKEGERRLRDGESVRLGIGDMLVFFERHNSFSYEFLRSQAGRIHIKERTRGWRPDNGGTITGKTRKIEVVPYEPLDKH